MLHIFEHSEPMPFRHVAFDEGFGRLQVLWKGLGGEAFEMRGTLGINGEFGVIRIGRIYTPGHLPKAFAPRRDEV